MKHAQIVTTSPDVSPVPTGTLPPKPAPRSAQVLINILVPEQAILAVVVQLVAENTRLVNVIVVMFGTENRVLSLMLVWKVLSSAIFLTAI